MLAISPLKLGLDKILKGLPFKTSNDNIAGKKPAVVAKRFKSSTMFNDGTRVSA